MVTGVMTPLPPPPNNSPEPSTVILRRAVFTFWKNGLCQGMGMIAPTLDYPPPAGAGRGRRWHLAAAMGSLVGAESEADVAAALLAHGRAIAGADGIAVARREGEDVRYIGEDAIAPLWARRSFPICACISGTAMLQNRPMLVPDIFGDRRVSVATYEPTFVRSLLMLPVGAVRPRLALGAYWAEAGPIDGEALDLLSQLTAQARLVLERIQGCSRPRARRSAAA
jgi:hypothetical protein